MASRAPRPGGGLRVATALLGVSAAGVLVGSRPIVLPELASVPVHEKQSTHRPPAEQPWLIGAGGWRFRFDTAGVDFPSVAENLADRPRTKADTVNLSEFDELIRFYAARSGLDWRLIAAVISAESSFDPWSRSPKGAYGLMQVRDIAARAVGESRFRQPADNIRTGVRYLRHLEAEFPKARGRDRLKLMLAAYNAGPGHMRDAQLLAKRLGLDPNRWYGGIREALLRLENPEVYRRYQHGYVNGEVTVAYVERVWEQFLKNQRATLGGTIAGPDPRSSSPDIAARTVLPGVS